MQSHAIEARAARFASPEQVADYVLSTTAKLAQDRYLGVGIPYIKYGRKVLYEWDAVDNYLAANTVQTRQPAA